MLPHQGEALSEGRMGSLDPIRGTAALSKGSYPPFPTERQQCGRSKSLILKDIYIYIPIYP